MFDKDSGANVPSRLEDVTLLRDSRVKCLSLLTGMTVGSYLELVELAYLTKGGLQGQREPLKSTTGRRIRSRMVDDIEKGAVLPPVVIGAVLTQDLDDIERMPHDQIMDLVRSNDTLSVSIIDGMQRTTALLEAVEKVPSVKDQLVRVECWLASNSDSLIYRMLVLNTGQVPWSIKQQLLVVYDSLIKEIRANVQFERLLSTEKAERRFNGGEFNETSLIEAYIAFGLRRTEIDTQETLADEFSRLDIAEAIASKKYDRYFYPMLQVLVNLDKAFSRLDSNHGILAEDGDASKQKFMIGRNIFDSQPARIGFMVACAQHVLGRQGMDKEEAQSDALLAKLTDSAGSLIARLDELDAPNLYSFLALDVLSERLGFQRRSAVGRHERAFFETAFKVLIDEDFAVPNMQVCWRA